MKRQPFCLWRHSAAACVPLLLSVLCPPAPAQAQTSDVADEAQFYFDRGNDSYRQGNFTEAVAAYYTSNRLVPNRNVQFNIARCLEKLGQHQQAFRAWSALLTNDLPDAERAQIQISIDRLRPHLALLSVTSSPPGATIYIDRKDLGAMGITPKLLALPEGQATLILERPGYRAVSMPISVSRGKSVDAQATLERIQGQLMLRGLPAQAQIRRGLIDGEVLRVGAGALTLAPGRVVLFATAAGYEPLRFEAEVLPDEVVPVDVPLVAKAAPSGAIVVQVNPVGALIRVDGKEMGFAPTVVENVTTGTRVIEVSHEGRTTFTQAVQITDGGRVYLDVKLARVDPFVSAATKSETRVDQAPASITVISRDEIMGFGWITVADALAGVRGAFSSNDRIYQSLGVRGLSPPGDYTNRILVLLDGHPMNDVLLGQGWVGHDLDVSLENVERIELVRGPASTLYGSAALFGVVNVVTRKARAGTHAEAYGQAGTLGRTAGRATATYAAKDLNVMVSAAGLNVDGDRRFAWDDGVTQALRADAEKASHAALALQWKIFSLRAGWNDRTKNVPTGAFATQAAPGTRYQDQRGYAELRADVPLRGYTLSARGAYDESRFKGRYLYMPDPAAPNADPAFSEALRARWVTGELRLTTPRVWRQELTVGGEVQRQFVLHLGDPSSAAQSEAGAQTETVMSGFLLDDLSITKGLRLHGGVRVDRYQNNFGTSINPRLAVIAQPYAAGTTKVTAGRAFRAPSTYERFYNDDGETQKRAPALDPEIITSIDLEHRHQVSDDVSVVAAGFANRIENLINLETDPIDGLLVYRNQGPAVRGIGGDGELRWEPGTGTRLTASYTYQQVRVRENGAYVPFVNAPTQLFALRSLIELLPGSARLGNELLYDLGRRTRTGDRVEDAVIWNITLSGSFPRQRLQYFAGMFNVLDVSGHAFGFPVGPEVPSATVSRYGRSARIGLSYHY
ncbi:MAG: TonB-dependent receptor [Deltaproteobacteria bacterium]|nr:TonB-dependent receptor [Deltaproteobacteria bacterium]